MPRTLRPVLLAAALAALATAVVIPLAAASISQSHSWTVTRVAIGLDNPRGLLLGPNGELLVAEAGHGGDSCLPTPPSGAFCIGVSSQISMVDTQTGGHTPIVSGLYSRSVTTEGITGVDGIAAQHGHLFGVITSYPQELDAWNCGGQPSDCTSVLDAARAQAGQLISFTPSGNWKALASVGSSDYQWALDNNHAYSREPANANPYGVFAVPAGEYVADAGANTLDFSAADGTTAIISAIAPPPPGGFPADTVPTCLTVLRGNLYAGSLSGHLWKRDDSFTPTDIPVVDANGNHLLHHITGCVSNENTGAIYLVDMWATPGPPIPNTAANTGSVIELAADGTATVLASGLNFPNGIARAPDGSLYVTVDSTCTATGSHLPYCVHGGQIVRLAGS
jgi:hypothetical protein